MNLFQEAFELEFAELSAHLRAFDSSLRTAVLLGPTSELTPLGIIKIIHCTKLVIVPPCKSIIICYERTDDQLAQSVTDLCAKLLLEVESKIPCVDHDVCIDVVIERKGSIVYQMSLKRIHGPRADNNPQ